MSQSKPLRVYHILIIETIILTRGFSQFELPMAQLNLTVCNNWHNNIHYPWGQPIQATQGIPY